MSHVLMALEEKAKNLGDELISLTKRNKALLKELEQTKGKLKHTMKWIRSSSLLCDMQIGCSTTKYGIGFKISEPKRIENNSGIMCTLCGNSSHMRDECNKNVEAIKSNHTYLERTYGRKIKNSSSSKRNLVG